MPKEFVINIPDIYLWALLLTLLLIFGFFTFIFSYHWNHYGFNSKSKMFAKGVYFFVSLSLIFVIIFFIGAYTLGLNI